MVKLNSKTKNNFPPLLHLTYDLQQLSDKKLMPSVGVGLGQIRILSGLHTSIPRSQKELSLALHQTEANISRQLKVLKSHGLVSVTRNKSDNRQRAVKLSTKGQKTYVKALKILSLQQAELLKLVSPKDKKVFEQATGNLVDMLGLDNRQLRKNL